MGRLEQKIKIKKQKKSIRRKKLLVFLMVFLFFQGIVLVDHEYSSMMGYEREMFIGCKRINSETIKFYFVGKEIDVHDKEVMESIQSTSDSAIQKTRVLIYKLKRKIRLLFTNEDFNPRGTRQI